MTEDFLAYLLFQIVLLSVNILAYNRNKILAYFGIIGSISLAVPTILAFGDYWMFGVWIVILNTVFPVYGMPIKR